MFEFVKRMKEALGYGEEPNPVTPPVESEAEVKPKLWQVHLNWSVRGNVLEELESHRGDSAGYDLRSSRREALLEDAESARDELDWKPKQYLDLDDALASEDLERLAKLMPIAVQLANHVRSQLQVRGRYRRV